MTYLHFIKATQYKHKKTKAAFELGFRSLFIVLPPTVRLTEFNSLID